MKRSAFAVLAFIALVAFHGLRGVAAPKKVLETGADSQVTFNRDVAPILFHSCAMCHRPGNPGPSRCLLIRMRNLTPGNSPR